MGQLYCLPRWVLGGEPGSESRLPGRRRMFYRTALLPGLLVTYILRVPWVQPEARGVQVLSGQANPLSHLQLSTH